MWIVCFVLLLGGEGCGRDSNYRRVSILALVVSPDRTADVCARLFSTGQVSFETWGTGRSEHPLVSTGSENTTLLHLGEHRTR